MRLVIIGPGSVWYGIDEKVVSLGDFASFAARFIVNSRACEARQTPWRAFGLTDLQTDGQKTDRQAAGTPAEEPEARPLGRYARCASS